MKGKRYTIEEKIRILRQADGGRKITDVCREHNVSEVTFHRWKKQFGQTDINEAKRLKELERENGELKKMLAEALLKNRVLEAVCKKMVSPAHRRRAALEVVDSKLCSGRAACRFLRLSRSTLWYRPRKATPLEERLGKRMESCRTGSRATATGESPPCCVVKAGEPASASCNGCGGAEACRCLQPGANGSGEATRRGCRRVRSTAAISRPGTS